MAELFIGLMSGTSLDGCDGVIVALEGEGALALEVLAHAHRPFDRALTGELLELNAAGANELHRAALAANDVARCYAECAQALFDASAVRKDAVRAIGAHGQTVRHRPKEFDDTGYTMQLLNAALLAELCGIDVVADFRSRDVAAGGQGAPLVPAFHEAMFGREGEAVGVVNIGGISNLTSIGADGSVLGFDCGPGNVLLDLWCERHTGRRYDAEGAWGATGRVDERLLAALRSERYFALPPPKSTGRDLFNAAWLDAALAACAASASARPEDVQATLAELTAWAIGDAVTRHAGAAHELLVCGGGAYNRDLLARIAARLPDASVLRTDDRGLPATQVEACAFAWLARAFFRRAPGNVPSVTGAAGPRVLGALHLA